MSNPLPAPEFKKGNRCPCGADILFAPGIGPFCARTGADEPCPPPTSQPFITDPVGKDTGASLNSPLPKVSFLDKPGWHCSRQCDWTTNSDSPKRTKYGPCPKCGCSEIVKNYQRVESSRLRELAAKICARIENGEISIGRVAEVTGLTHQELMDMHIEVRPLPASEPPTTTCRWVEDSDGPWTTSCGKTWQFIDDGPVENGVVYCVKCGRLVEPVPCVEEIES